MDFDHFGEAECYDTCDSITDVPDRPLDDGEHGIFPLGADGMGMAFALADEIADANRAAQYDLDEDTDAMNMALAMSSDGDEYYYEKLRPFEQYIDDICKGRRKLFGG